MITTLRNLGLFNNGAWETERNIEIPKAYAFLQSHPQAVELGAVLPYFGKIDHPVYDLHDQYTKSIREDITHLDFEGKDIISVSTVEHVGREDYKTDGETRQQIGSDFAFKLLERIYLSSKSCFITIPVGYHPVLDSSLKKSNIPFSCWYRQQPLPYEWKRSLDNFNFAYLDFPGSATAVFFIEKD